MNMTQDQLVALMASIIWAGHYAKREDPGLGIGMDTCIDDARKIILLAHK